MISKHPRPTFSERAGALRTVLVIHYNIHSINNFLPYYAYANSEGSGKLRSYARSTWSMFTFQNRVFYFQ